MITNPNRIEIDHHTIKFIIGLIAIFLAVLTTYFSTLTNPTQELIKSISASYHVGFWPRDLFVGLLFAISAFLLAYNGRSKIEMILSKIASLAAASVAMFPCECGNHIEIIPNVHGISAAIMFLMLVGFCIVFLRRAYDKEHAEARRRVKIYVASGIIIIASILILAIDGVFGGFISEKISRLTFYGEAAGLTAFGIAWLTASRTLPLITSKSERLSLY